MCEYNYAQENYCGISFCNETNFFPSLQPHQCYDYDSFCQNIPPYICKPPEKLRGLPVELAVRKEPCKGYPKRSIRNKEPKTKLVESVSDTNVLKNKLLDPDYAILHDQISSPVWTTRFCLKRIHTLLVRDETAKKSESRIWNLWRHCDRISKDVFIYDNVDVVANIILVLSTSFLRLPYSSHLFDKIMLRLQRGIYMESKDVVDTKRLAYFFTVLGLSIVEGHPIAQASICSIIGVWLENVVDKWQRGNHKQNQSRNIRRCPFTSRLMKPSSQLTVMVPDSILVSALEKSLLPRIICKYFSEGSHTLGYISMLTLLKSCCEISTVIRDRLLGMPVLDPVLLKLSITDPSNRIMITTSEFIYSYFGISSDPKRTDSSESQNTSNTIVPILEKDSFQILLTRLFDQLSHCASKSLLSVRNDTAFLICLIGERVPTSGEYYEGFGLSFASIVSSAIFGLKGLDITYLIDSTPEDLELLQYLIFMIKCILEAGYGEEIIEEYKTADALLRMLLGPCNLTTTPSGDNVVISGEGEKGNDLENAAWATILAIAKHCPLSLLTPHGVSSLLTFLKAYGERGEGNQRILAMCMHTFRIILTTPDEDSCVSDEVMGYFIERDGMAIFLHVLEQLVKQKFDQLQESVVSNILYCCAAFAYYDYNQKEVFLDRDGVSILIRLIKHLICPSADMRHMNPVIQMAVAECICCCVAYHPPSLERFLEMEGIFRLLELLEVSAGPASPVHLINCILQLSDYPRCIDQMLYWHRPMKRVSQRVVCGEELDVLAKSWEKDGVNQPLKCGDVLQELQTPNDQTLFSMLCTLWKEEEARAEVLRDPEGCIASIIHPLMSKFARSYNQANEEKGVSKSCLDMVLSLRPKIFLLIKRIVEVTKTEAILFDGLSLTNQIIMQIIINFVDLKKSEICIEIVNELERRESTFAPGDGENILKLAEVSRNTLATVLETQRYLIRRFHEKEEMNENEFYSLLKQCRLQDHLMAAKEIEYLARTTNYKFLVEKRLWQKSELECAVKELGIAFTKNSRIHRTSDGTLNITAWPCQTRYLVSEPKITHEDAGLENYDDNDDFIGESSSDEEEERKRTLLSGPSASTIMSNSNIVPSVGLITSFAVTETITPEPVECGFYQVSAHRLRESLKRLVADRRKHEKWISLAENDEENYWKVRTKWRQDWYPLRQTE